MPKTNRVISKSSKSTGRAKSQPKTTLGNSNKSIRDGADPNARGGKKPTLAKGDFRGELVVEAKLTAVQKEEILNIARSSKKTPGDDSHVVSLTDKGGKITIRTSSDDLAVAIGKKIHASHKGGKLTVTWGKDEAPARVLWKK